IEHTPVKERDLYDRMVFQGFDRDGRINGAVGEGAMAYYVATGQLPAPIDLDQLIDMVFADYAVQEIGPYPREAAIPGRGGREWRAGSARPKVMSSASVEGSSHARAMPRARGRPAERQRRQIECGVRR